jgi:hypothetical protein
MEVNSEKTEQLETGKYKIQVIVTADEIKAKDIVSELSILFQVKSFYEKSGNLFKVYAGFFNDEKLAQDTLTKIRETKYADAWLVY